MSCFNVYLPLSFSDEELETIFRKAFIRSKSKNPTEMKVTESQLIKQDWSNQICDISNGLNEELRKTPEQAVIMMSFSDNSNTYTSTSDSDSIHQSDNQSVHSAGDLTSRLNCVEASVNITTIQQSSANVSMPQKELKTSLSKEHTVLTSLLEKRTDNVTKDTAFKPTSSTSKSLFESPFLSSAGILSSSSTNKNDLNINSSGSNITHLSQSNDLNNFKIEIVMELDKGMANGINSDSKYKIKIGPEHFNNLCGNDFPKRIEHNPSSVCVESFSASETISSSYQIKSTNHLSTDCDSNHGRQNDVFNRITNNGNDCTNDEAKTIEKKDVKHDHKCINKNILNLKKHNNKGKHDRPRKHSLTSIDDDVKFTSAIPSKQYCRNKEQPYRKQERYKDKYKKRNKMDHLPDGKPPVDTDKNCNESQFTSAQIDELKTNTSEDQNVQRCPQLNDFENEKKHLIQSCKIKEIPEECEETVDNDDDDVVLLEEKRTNIQHVKHDSISIDSETPIHIVKSDTTTLANNFFLISNDLSKDKQNVKYLILNNNNLFKTLNFDGANKTQTNTSISNENRQGNLLLLNNEKNGNLFFLNKDAMKQPNNFVLNNNGLYNPCETQYFIINDTSANLQQKITDINQNKSAAPLDNTFSYTTNCDNSQVVNSSPREQIKIAMDTPVDIQDDSIVNSCDRNYVPQLDCDKSMENTDMPMLSQEPASNNKDLIQNKENILVLNNHVEEEHFKFDSNDSSVQVRLDDSMYYLNEKISNELKMGGGGKCSEIPQIYFINDLESPLSVSNEYCVDTNVKDTMHCTSSDQTTNQLELLNYDDLDKSQNSSTDSNTVVTDDMNSNIAQLNDKYVLPTLFKPNANSSFKDDKTKLPDVKLSNTKEADTPSLKIKPVPSKSKLTSLKQNSSSFLKHLKSKLDKQKPVSKNQILNKAPSNYLNKNAPIVKKVKLDDMDSVLTNDPVENASKILALCMKKETEAQQKSLSCHICSMVFCDEKVLNKHVEEHSSLGKFTCTVCKKVFNNMKTLKTHSRIHTGEKPFR